MSNQGPLFSILIPTYNSGETLSVALDSIANQRFKDVEVVIQDGGSTDDTLTVVENFKSKLKGISIFSEKDKGIYDAMNKAIDHATGQWVLFLGSDDRFYSENVLKEVSQIIKDTEAKVLYGNVRIQGDTGWAKDGNIYDGAFTVEKLLNQNICHQAMFYNTAFLKKEVGYFNTEYKKSSDWDYNLKCWAKQPFQYMDITVAHFAAGGFSSHSDDEKIYSDFVDNVLTYFGVSPFHALVNSPTFNFYHKVLKKQQQEYPIQFAWEKFKKRIGKKINS